MKAINMAGKFSTPILFLVLAVISKNIVNCCRSQPTENIEMIEIQSRIEKILHKLENTSTLHEAQTLDMLKQVADTQNQSVNILNVMKSTQAQIISALQNQEEKQGLLYEVVQNHQNILIQMLKALDNIQTSQDAILNTQNTILDTQNQTELITTFTQTRIISALRNQEEKEDQLFRMVQNQQNILIQIAKSLDNIQTNQDAVLNTQNTIVDIQNQTTLISTSQTQIITALQNQDDKQDQLFRVVQNQQNILIQIAKSLDNIQTRQDAVLNTQNTILDMQNQTKVFHDQAVKEFQIHDYKLENITEAVVLIRRQQENQGAVLTGVASSLEIIRQRYL